MERKQCIQKFIITIIFVFTFLSIQNINVNAQNNEFVIDRNGVLRRYDGIGGDVVIPKGVKIIGEKAFSGNTDITSVRIPDSVTQIEASAFDSCSALKQVTLSANLTSIEDCAFWGCTALTDIEIPGKVKTIGFGAFCMCDNLKNIYIPKNVKQIGNYALGFLCSGNQYIKVIEYMIMGQDKSAAQEYASKYDLTFITENTLKTSLQTLKKNASNKLLITWKKNRYITMYELEISTDRKFTASKTQKITLKSNAKKYYYKINPQKKYYVRIRGYKTICGKKYYSPWSKAKKI